MGLYPLGSAWLQLAGGSVVVVVVMMVVLVLSVVLGGLSNPHPATTAATKATRINIKTPTRLLHGATPLLNPTVD